MPVEHPPLERLQALERLDYEQGRQRYAAELAEELAAAEAKVPKLRPWAGLPYRSYRIYTRGANVVRLARLLDLVQHGERVLDVGAGRGYVTALLLANRQIEHYCGIDLRGDYLPVVAEGLRVNNIDGMPHALHTLDLYDLTAEFVAPHRPTLVIVLEVLEHLRDPELALATIARAVGDADILFTVPMRGRLENVKGHLSRFDACRVQAMCSGAGLYLHHVEPVHNTWTLAVASRRQDLPARLT